MKKNPCLHYRKNPLKNHSLQENFFYECGPSCVPFTYLRTWKFLIHEQDRWYFGGPCQNLRELVKYSTIFITNLLPYKSFKLYFASNNFLCIFDVKLNSASAAPLCPLTLCFGYRLLYEHFHNSLLIYFFVPGGWGWGAFCHVSPRYHTSIIFLHIVAKKRYSEKEMISWLNKFKYSN